MASTPPEEPSQSVGPDYRSEKQKPIATVSTEVKFENVHVLPQTPQLIALLTYVYLFPSIESIEQIKIPSFTTPILIT